MGIQIDKLIRSKRRSIGLEISDKGELIIRAPRLASRRSIERAVESRKKWIEEKQRMVKKKNSLYKPKSFIEGEDFLFLGGKYKLHIVNGVDEKLKFDNDFYLDEKWHIKAPALFIYWYKQEAKRIITERVQFYAGLNDFSYSKIKISVN